MVTFFKNLECEQTKVCVQLKKKENAYDLQNIVSTYDDVRI